MGNTESSFTAAALAGAAPLFEIRRGNVLEAVHLGHLAVRSPVGEDLLTAGDGSAVFLLRSSAKPVQALVSVLEGTVDALELTDAEFAAACASHSGEARHAAAARSILEKAGISEEALLCGVHKGFGSMQGKEGPDWCSAHNNCSGKHALMLATCKRMGWPLETYQSIDHPLQQAIREHIALLSYTDERQIQVGVDGCGVPVWGISLDGAARMFATLSDPARLDPELARACRRVIAAMMAHPEMVAGQDRFCTDLMVAAGGAAWGKLGAEGYYAVGVLPGDSREACGLAMKVLDGDPLERARAAVVIEFLERRGVISLEDGEALRKKYAPRQVLSHRGVGAGTARVLID